MSKTVVVLGAGVGGLTAARRLRELLPDEARVVLIDRSFRGVLGLSLLWVLRGWRRPNEVTFAPTQAAFPGVELIEAEVQGIDVGRRAVSTNAGDVAYDALVIALGAATAPSRLPGLMDAMADGAIGEFYSLDGAARLRERLVAVDSGRVGVLIAGTPFKCPAAPFEGAFLIDDLLRERGVRDRIQIDVYTPDPLPMPVAGPVVGNALVNMLASAEIGFYPSVSVERLERDGHEVRFADGTRSEADLLVVVSPHLPPTPVAVAGLDPAGWVPVDPATLRAEPDGVWAIGDVAAITLPNGKPLPKAGVFAAGEAEVAAAGVARHLGYDAPAVEFTGHGHCYVEVGGHRAARGAGNFYHPDGPQITLTEPSAEQHAAKEREEADWLSTWR